jgi:hypothetical protein
MSDSKLYLISGNINFTSPDPDSNSITTKKLMRLVWANTEQDAMFKLQTNLAKVAAESNYSYYLSEIIVSEALQ